MAENSQKKSGFGLGVLIGTVLGGLAALFVAPKTGKETREMAKKWLREELKIIKEKAKKIDKRKYQQAVEKVLKKVKKELKKDSKELAKIKRQLMREWKGWKKKKEVLNK